MALPLRHPARGRAFRRCGWQGASRRGRGEPGRRGQAEKGRQRALLGFWKVGFTRKRSSAGQLRTDSRVVRAGLWARARAIDQTQHQEEEQEVKELHSLPPFFLATRPLCLRGRVQHNRCQRRGALIGCNLGLRNCCIWRACCGRLKGRGRRAPTWLSHAANSPGRAGRDGLPARPRKRTVPRRAAGPNASLPDTSSWLAYVTFSCSGRASGRSGGSARSPGRTGTKGSGGTSLRSPPVRVSAGALRPTLQGQHVRCHSRPRRRAGQAGFSLRAEFSAGAVPARRGAGLPAVPGCRLDQVRLWYHVEAWPFQAGAVNGGDRVGRAGGPG